MNVLKVLYLKERGEVVFMDMADRSGVLFVCALVSFLFQSNDSYVLYTSFTMVFFKSNFQEKTVLCN